MILVADCSALIALSICNSLELLEQVFSQVIVPEAVYLEATQPNKKHAHELKLYLKGKVRKVDMQHYVFLDGFADAGETEAMLLGIPQTLKSRYNGGYCEYNPDQQRLKK